MRTTIHTHDKPATPQRIREEDSALTSPNENVSETKTSLVATSYTRLRLIVGRNGEIIVYIL